MLAKKWNKEAGGYIFIVIDKKPPACYDCRFRQDISGSYCCRIITDKTEVYNTITGKTETHHYGPRCQVERYSDNTQCCGMEGKFFKPIPKPRPVNPGEALPLNIFLEQNKI